MTATAAVTLECDAAPVDLAVEDDDRRPRGRRPIVYTITATNNGDVTLTNVQISESLTDATVVGTCPAATLAPTATTSCQFTYTAKQSDVDAGSLTNSASVVGTPPSGSDVTATAAVT